MEVPEALLDRLPMEVPEASTAGSRCSGSMCRWIEVAGSGSKDSGLVLALPFRAPNMRLRRGRAMGTRRTTGSSPRAITMSSPAQALLMSRDRSVSAAWIVVRMMPSLAKQGWSIKVLGGTHAHEALHPGVENYDPHSRRGRYSALVEIGFARICRVFLEKSVPSPRPEAQL